MNVELKMNARILSYRDSFGTENRAWQKIKGKMRDGRLPERDVKSNDRQTTVNLYSKYNKSKGMTLDVYGKNYTVKIK